MALTEPVFDRLSDADFLERVEQGDTQNPNELSPPQSHLEPSSKAHIGFS